MKSTACLTVLISAATSSSISIWVAMAAIYWRRGGEESRGDGRQGECGRIRKGTGEREREQTLERVFFILWPKSEYMYTRSRELKVYMCPANIIRSTDHAKTTCVVTEKPNKLTSRRTTRYRHPPLSLISSTRGLKLGAPAHRVIQCDNIEVHTRYYTIAVHVLRGPQQVKRAARSCLRTRWALT